MYCVENKKWMNPNMIHFQSQEIPADDRKTFLKN